ncbi:MAG TPA: hypothetical protein VFH51_14770 [Myxococcota bacterium]|nr:hypothetical protein [Myxococcota bacterium]
MLEAFGEDAEGRLVAVGQLVLTELFVASRFGDRELHFEHNAPH